MVDKSLAIALQNIFKGPNTLEVNSVLKTQPNREMNPVRAEEAAFVQKLNANPELAVDDYANDPEFIKFKNDRMGQVERGLDARLGNHQPSPAYNLQDIIEHATIKPGNASGMTGVMDLMDARYKEVIDMLVQKAERHRYTPEELLRNAMRDLLPKKGELSGVEKAVKELELDNERMKFKKDK